MNMSIMRSNSIDVLKCLAIFAVVLYHASILPYGYLGVDLFLVINGYLVTKSLYNKYLSLEYRGKDEKLTLLRDYFRFEVGKIERLLPVLLIACTVCMVIGWFIMIDDTYESLCQSVIATSFFGNNVVELIATGDYWGGGKIFNPLMHTWYVGVLMQFYLFYPIIFILAKRSSDYKKAITSILFILTIFSFILYLSEDNQSYRFYLVWYRFFEFGLGGLVALCHVSFSKHLFNKYFVYLCYVSLLGLFVIDIGFIPSNVKLVLVCVLSCIILSSYDTIENAVTGNIILAKIGSASYSIFVWHQLVFAIFRSIKGGESTLLSFIICIVIVAVLSWLSFVFLEQRIGSLLKSIRGRKVVYIVFGSLFIILNSITFKIYLNAGVVRDIPELEVKKEEPCRSMWPKYNDRIFDYDKDFVTNKKHWLVIGNSYARDFSNIILESEVSEKVEVSYSAQYDNPNMDQRYREADLIFVASKDYTDALIRGVEIHALAMGHDLNDVIIVGDKRFGETMTQIYVRRHNPDYYYTTLPVEQSVMDRNSFIKAKYHERFIDMIEMVSTDHGSVRLFTQENKLISPDCVHLTRAGALYYARKIEWGNYLHID